MHTANGCTQPRFRGSSHTAPFRAATKKRLQKHRRFLAGTRRSAHTSSFTIDFEHSGHFARLCRTAQGLQHLAGGGSPLSAHSRRPIQTWSHRLKFNMGRGTQCTLKGVHAASLTIESGGRAEPAADRRTAQIVQQVARGGCATTCCI